MERIAEKIKIDSFTLKMIAMLSMLADHIWSSFGFLSRFYFV